MKIIIDNKIPYINKAIEKLTHDVTFISGKDFTPDIVRDADALIVRTRTRCNRELLEGSRVKFIATATIGFDHIDTDYCHEAGITWTNAPGCNSASVAQYIESVLILLKLFQKKRLDEMTLGIVGVGNVGSKIVKVAEAQGMRVLLNDLPREDKEGSTAFCSLEQLAQECDIITFHVPLYKEGKYKTYHLADEAFFQSLQRKPIIINTSRGEVIKTEAILKALNTGLISDTVIDVWENEPKINLELLNKVLLGTPHIAGYSADGKANATRMSLDALCRFFNTPTDYKITPPEPQNKIVKASTLDEALLSIYDPRRDSEVLKTHPELFEKLRGDYPLRREKEAYSFQIPSHQPTSDQVPFQ
ncbi:4-phosphoerythronate dehydrogenase PdxB [Oscillospiraceae bacterium N12]|jgi:erythronate-4-phosphate dehydrogenase|uniref:Erythronate-4-phosphate dehydrogenase n=1 Tax=Jilunia laotingensis TaxID=2763675 RepID=A0A926IQD0_9BACT|nr:4-phosphoerythronate dehydrogenase PdxB [Jilunia laotingensis]MBC8592588.1 4-phosphoerythronate dehydrogenase PdxB [Jilunia laotingensis]